VAAATFILSLASWAPASAQVFFRMDYSAAAAPVAAWPGQINPSASTFSRSRIAAGGPMGEDVYELTQLGAGMSGGQFYWGWNGNLESTDPPQGARRFYRWRMRFSPTTNFRGIHWDNGGPTTITNKVLMIGDGCGRNRCRVIVTYRGADNGYQAQYMRVQIDGGEDPADSPPIRVGEWVDIQVELDSSTTTSSGDGGYKIWINNNNYAQPTAQRMNIQLNPVRWQYVYLGAYNNDGLAPGGVHSWRQTGFEAATSFDPTWYRGGATGTLPAPTNLRAI
jgi:hypothetical protein